MQKDKEAEEGPDGAGMDAELPEASVKEMDFEYAHAIHRLAEFQPVCGCSDDEGKEEKGESVSSVVSLLSDAALKSHLAVRLPARPPAALAVR